MSERLVPPHESSMHSDDIDKVPIVGIYDGIGVYPRGHKLVEWYQSVYALGVVSSGLAPAELTDLTDNTIQPSCCAQLSGYPNSNIDCPILETNDYDR